MNRKMIGYKNITLTSGLWLKCSNHCGDIMRMCIYIYICRMDISSTKWSFDRNRCRGPQTDRNVFEGVIEDFSLINSRWPIVLSMQGLLQSNPTQRSQLARGYNQASIFVFCNVEMSFFHPLVDRNRTEMD